MANDFKPVILAQLGNPPPPTRSERDVVYAKVRAGFEAVFEGLDAPSERDAHAHALNDAIAEIEAELAVTSAAAVLAEAAPADATLPRPAASRGERRMPGLRTLVAAIATLAIVSACGWYLLSTERPATVQPSVRTSQAPADAVAQKDLDPAATDKGRSFQDAMHNGDAATVAFLLNSGYRPTRVELRNALLQVKYSDAVKVAIASLDADVRDIACSFTTLLDVRKPMLRPSLFDAEDAFLIMKQIGQDQWRSLCAAESGKWREALARIEQQNAQYSKPDAEKKKEAEACIGKFSTPEANERWEQANCGACPESHSSCETYCPQAPKAQDADEARFFHFNRSDMSMAAMAAPRRNRAELFCNLQYMTKTTDFDLANLQRFRDLVGLLN
jgi:hypothetical protein